MPACGWGILEQSGHSRALQGEGDGEEKGVLCTRRKMPLPRVLKVLYLQVDFETGEICHGDRVKARLGPRLGSQTRGRVLTVCFQLCPSPHTPGVHIQACSTQVCPPVPWFLESLPSKPGEGPAADSALV